jgi:hypothetical protein
MDKIPGPVWRRLMGEGRLWDKVDEGLIISKTSHNPCSLAPFFTLGTRKNPLGSDFVSIQ